MKTNIIFIALFLAFNSICYAQNKGFYLKVKNDGLTPNATTGVEFATEVNENEIIYLQNYYIYENDQPFAKSIGNKTYLVRSDKDGNKSKEIFIQNDSLKFLLFYGIRDRDKVVVFGTAVSQDSFFVISRTYDLDLNLVHEDINTLSTAENNKDWFGLRFPLFNWLDGKLHICYSSENPLTKCLLFQYDEKSQLLKHNIDKPAGWDGIVVRAYTITPDKKQIVVLGTFSRRYIDMDLNFIRDEWFDFNEVSDSSLYYFGKYLPYENGTYIGFGSADAFDVDNHRGTRVLGIANEQLRLKTPIYVSEFLEGDFSDGPPRYTGGLFKGTDGYYTCYEAVPDGADFPTANTFFISKYDFAFNPVWEKRFIMESGVRFFNTYAELTPDNSFLISGFFSIFDPILEFPDNVGGHIIGLKPDGNPSTLSTSSSDKEALFSVQENPVSNFFVINKSLNNTKDYKVNIADISGKRMASSQVWADGIMSINVSNYLPGTYIYTITDGSKIIYSGKFIKI